MQWTDCHAHPTDARFEGEWPAVWQRAVKFGVQRLLCGGYDPDDWAKQWALHQGDGRIIPCFGLHPYFVAGADRETCDRAMSLLQSQSDRFLLMGEVGIDKRPAYAAALAQQIEYLERQLDLAISLKKVPVYHIVRGHSEAQPVLKARAGRLRGGIVHAFTGNRQTARFYLDHGCWLSIGPHLLRSTNVAPLRAAIKDAPLDRLLIESDAPDGRLTPEAGLGEPAVVEKIAAAIGDIKSVSLERMAQTIEASVMEILSLSVEVASQEER